MPQVTINNGDTGLAARSAINGNFNELYGGSFLAAGTAAAPSLSFAADANTGLFSPAADTVAIATAGAERFRVTSIGRVGINTNTPLSPLHVVVPTGGDGTVLRLVNPNAGGGCRATLTNGAGDVWDFGMGASGPFLVRSAGAVARMIVNTGSITTGSDNTMSLGTAGVRLTEVFAVNPIINTSDGREKLWRGPLNEAELRAARRIASEIGVYQWLDAIEEKGVAKARLHVGVRAQKVWDIFAEEGLVDPIGANEKPGKTPYASLCWDKWDAKTENEDGVVAEAGNRYGLREQHLIYMVLAAQEQRLSALENSA